MFGMDKLLHVSTLESQGKSLQLNFASLQGSCMKTKQIKGPHKFAVVCIFNFENQFPFRFDNKFYLKLK